MRKISIPLSSFKTIGLLVIFVAVSVHAKSPVLIQEKPNHDLFHPVPDELMREMVTDRPDKTESPYTVDAGHFQIESDLVNWTRNRDSGIAYDSIDVASVNLRIGLTDSLDFHIIMNPYHYERIRSQQSRETSSGFGDLTLRAKLNFWGNDSGNTAFGIIPFVTLPTASNGFGVANTEGGIILPLNLKLAEGWELGMMTEWDFVSAEEGGYTHSFINSCSLGHELTKQLGMYLEFYSEIPSENTGDWIGTVDVGFTFAVTDNIQLDAGVNFGVTESADKLNPFIGVSIRF